MPRPFNQMEFNQNLQASMQADGMNPSMDDNNNSGAYNSHGGTGSGGAGLSSSSFANLRKRALDAGRQQMMQNIIKDAHQHEEGRNFEGEDA
jgi:hypothetical protein